MKKSLFLLCSVFAFFSLPTIAADETNLLPLLNKMSKAMRNLNYEVAFVQTSPSNMDSFRYRHIKQDRKTYAQLVTLDGEQQEIIQRDNLVSYFQHNSKAFTINSSNIIDALPAIIHSDFNKLSKNYDFVELGKNRVAGRFVDTVRIVPKDDFRYQYLIFVDEENGLLLRSDMLDRDGNLLDQYRVVTLYIDDRLRGLTNYLNKVSMPPMLQTTLSTIVPPEIIWSAGWMPEGFELIKQGQENVDEEIVDSKLFSDGLFTFTINVAKVANAQQASEKTWKQGPYTIHSEIVGDKEITFIGQLPIATAKRIVQDIKFTN